MRKLTVILLLITFTVAQYAKQVSYMECILSNYFKVSAEKCDCEKMLNKGKNAADQSPLPVSHRHIHVDESYFPPLIASRVLYADDCSATFFFGVESPLHDGICDKPYPPPRVDC